MGSILDDLYLSRQAKAKIPAIQLCYAQKVKKKNNNNFLVE
jgi:hypothetical protein